jgi:hypothetical protein
MDYDKYDNQHEDEQEEEYEAEEEEEQQDEDLATGQIKNQGGNKLDFLKRTDEDGKIFIYN